MPYVTGGMQPDWLEVVRALADAGADAIEVGIPFSDPVMDGPIIQQASELALAQERPRWAWSRPSPMSTPASRSRS